MQCNVRAFGLLVMAGCTVGAPPGFSAGDRWTFPLVGPLEDGLLVTPATVRGHGPYLFAIDPDANISAVDKQVVDDAALRTSAGPRIIDETETGQIRLYAELIDLQVAGLKVARRDVLLFPVGFYDTQGRHLSGVLGRDVIADSLVFGFDRNQGIATLSTSKVFTPPPDALTITYENLSGDSGRVAGQYPAGTMTVRGDAPRGITDSDVPLRPGSVDPFGDNVPSRINEAERQDYRNNDVVPVPRRIARVQIGRAKLTMHLDLGAAVSQLPEESWSDLHLTAGDTKLRLVDEAASVRYVNKLGVAAEVTLGPVKAHEVAFVPFVDQRFPKQTIDGALGLDFFRAFTVYANWDKRTYYLTPRGDAAATTTARLGRWGAALPACPHPGCVTAQLVASPDSPGIDVVRDAEAANRGLEVVLAVTPAAGKSAPPLIVELPRGVDKLTNALPVDYTGATVRVADVSPFPRACVGEGGCVLPLDESLARGILSPEAVAAAPAAAPPADTPSPSAAPPDASPARSVPIDKLRRLSGDVAIPPSDDVKKAAADRPLAIAIVKLCLAADGAVESTKIVKSSGVSAYDDQLQSVIKATWRFSPIDAGGKPERICTSVTFATTR